MKLASALMLFLLFFLAFAPAFMRLASATVTVYNTTYMTYPSYSTLFNFDSTQTLSAIYQEGSGNATYPEYWFETLLSGSKYGLQSEDANFTVTTNFVSNTLTYLVYGAGTVNVYVGALGEPVSVSGASYTYDAGSNVASITSTGAGGVIVSWSALPPDTVTLTITYPTDGSSYLTSNVLVSLSASGGTVDTIWFNVRNGSSWVYSESQVYTAPYLMSGFTNGSYTIYAYANNTVGSVASDTASFTVAIPSAGYSPGLPSVNVVRPINASYVVSTIAVNIVSSNADAVWYNVKNGSSWVYTYNQTYSAATSKSGFSNGTYTFYAFAANSEGGFAQDSVVFTVGASSTVVLPHVDMSGFWLFMWEGNFLGLIQAYLIHSFANIETAIALIVMLFMVPLYLRSKSLLLLCILWLLIGSFIVVAVPIASGVAVLFMVLAIAGLIWRLFRHSSYG